MWEYVELMSETAKENGHPADAEWCKGEQTEYMEMLEYINNELKSVLK